MGFSEACQMPIHAVFACHLSAFWKVIYLLIARQALVHLHFDIGGRPADGPVLVSFGCLSEAIVFQRVPEKSDYYIIVKLEKVSLIRWQVRPNSNRIYVRSENQKFFLLDVVYCCFGNECLLVREVKFTRFMFDLHLIYLLFNFKSFRRCSWHLRL